MFHAEGCMSAMFPAQKPYYGPFLKFQSYSQTESRTEWTGSVLFVCESYLAQAGHLTLLLGDQGVQRILQGYFMDTFLNWTIWRFDLVLELHSNARDISYQIQFPDLNHRMVQPVTFTVPGATQRWRWAAYSCSGYSSSVDRSKWGGERHPLFQDLMKEHAKDPFHALVGGGDQLYNDKVFVASAELQEWLRIKNRKERLAVLFSDKMRLEAEEFYFQNYCTCFTEQDMGDAFASIPNVMIWDDHDIFDGWGSYPDDLLYCPVFQGIYHVACRFYLLFQQHCTYRMVMEGKTEFFGRVGRSNHTSFNFVKQFGPDVAIVGVDIRAERSKTQVVSYETWDMIFSCIRSLPQSVMHVVLVLTVPILYPKVPLTEASLQFLSNLNKIDTINFLMQKTGLLSHIMEFDEPELLDDLVDHWTSSAHSHERRVVVNQLQAIAKEKCFRLLFLSGDVHCAALGQFYSDPKLDDLSGDYRYIPQIITSAIVNAPPPNIIIKMMHVFNKAKKSVNSSTREKMVRTFKGRYSNTDKVMGRRNYLIVQAGQLGDPGLRCTLRIELPHSLGSCETFDFCVPHLVHQQEWVGQAEVASLESCSTSSLHIPRVPSGVLSDVGGYPYAEFCQPGGVDQELTYSPLGFLQNNAPYEHQYYEPQV